MKADQCPLPEHNAHPAYRPDIDGLRAVAILSVVIFHAFPTFLRGGFVGVDVFFVISGFLISSIIFRSLQRGDFSFVEFYAHRAKRIFPALSVVLVACFTCGWFVLLPDEFKQLGKHIAAGAGFVQNFVLLNEAGYFDTASELKPLMHLWSLAIEEQFYLFYPLLIWGAWRFGVNVLAVVIFIALLSFGLNIYELERDVAKTFFAPQTRFWELFAGSVLAYLQLFMRSQCSEKIKNCHFLQPLRGKSPKPVQYEIALKNLLSVIGLSLIFAAVLLVHKGRLFPGWWALGPVAGAFLLIFSGQEAWVNRKILANRFMVFVGMISYPLYLWHWPIISFVTILDSGVPSFAIRGFAVALSFLLAWLTYRFVERPIRFGRKTWIKTAILFGLLGLIAYIGYNTSERNGLPFRVKVSGSDIKQFSWDASLHREAICLKENPISKARLQNAYCLGSRTLADIALIGDSHSNSLAAGLIELFPQRILNLAGGGCIPFFDVDSGIKGQNPQCPSEDSKLFLDVVENTATLSTVIISLRGPLYLSGTGFGPKEADTSRYIKWTGVPDAGDYADVYEKSMRATLARFVAKKKKLIFVIDVPELGFDPKTCVESLLLRATSRTKSTCAVLRSEYDKRNFEYRHLVFNVLKDFPEVKAFDSSVALCDSEWCWAMRDRQVLYRDDNHLSVSGSRYVAASLAELINEK